MRAAPDAPARGAALRFALRLGLISFGGPAGQIAILHRELVARRGWIGDAEFARALNFCMLLPGPEALQLVSWLGWRWFGIAGGLVAGLWLLPLAAVVLGAPHPLPARLYLFFSKVALVGFGGAYAVLSYVNQELVGHLHWLSPPDLIAALALAETTPGPLVLVPQFYGFATGWAAPGPLAPPAAVLLCAGLASWATFLPSFVLVMALAPYVERLAAQPRLAAALEAVTAAVVGVIGSFALAVALAVLPPAGVTRPDRAAVRSARCPGCPSRARRAT